MTIEQIEKEQLEANQSVMAALDKTGDTKLIWDRTKPVEVENAKANFKRLKDAGYAAYSVTGEKGTKGEVLHAFDPEAERIILAPPMKGG